MVTTDQSIPHTSIQRVEADGVTIFYREAEAFRRDNPNATVQFLDTGHFALETHVEDIANAVRDFLQKLQDRTA